MMERWDENYKYNAEIEGAYDSDLLKMAMDGDGDFASACLHDLAWRHDAMWDENEELYETYNRLLPMGEEFPTWRECFNCDYYEEFGELTDKELIERAEKAETWDTYSSGCLWEICFRHDLGWDTIDKHWDFEGVDDKFIRVKKWFSQFEEV